LSQASLDRTDPAWQSSCWKKGYQVFGMVRRSSSERMERIEHLIEHITLIKGELMDVLLLFEVVSKVQPDELCSLGAMSFVKDSFSQPTQCRLLEWAQ